MGCVSVDLDYYFNSPQELAAVARQVNRVLGSTLAPYQGDPDDYFAWFMGMEFSLLPERGLYDDGELDYSSFRYSAGFRTTTGTLLPIQLPVMLAVVRVLQCEARLGGMLVYDAQMLLARYVPKDPPVPANSLEAPFTDVVSGTDLDDFGRHLTAVASRLGSHSPFAP